MFVLFSFLIYLFDDETHANYQTHVVSYIDLLLTALGHSQEPEVTYENKVKENKNDQQIIFREKKREKTTITTTALRLNDE